MEKSWNFIPYRYVWLMPSEFDPNGIWLWSVGSSGNYRICIWYIYTFQDVNVGREDVEKITSSKNVLSTVRSPSIGSSTSKVRWLFSFIFTWVNTCHVFWLHLFVCLVILCSTTCLSTGLCPVTSCAICLSVCHWRPCQSFCVLLILERLLSAAHNRTFAAASLLICNSLLHDV